MNAFLVSHNGLGDNLYMIGALRFLIKFYKNVYFLCKKKYYENIKLFFIDTQNIICIPFDENKERNSIINILNEASINLYNDIFVCGMFMKNSFNTRISNKEFINNIFLEKPKTNFNDYKIDYDTLTSQNYSFIEHFYKDIGMDLSIFYNYYKIPETQESLELYNKIKDFYIIFIQLKSSCGKSLNISKLIKKYINDEKSILICNDVNLYIDYIKQNNLSGHEIKNFSNKIELCENFKYNKLVNYYHTIINSNEIYIIDSCFIGIVLPLLKQNKLKANTVRIILRDIASQIQL